MAPLHSRIWDPNRAFKRDDLSVGEAFAERAAVAIDNARLLRDAQAAEARFRGLFHGAAEAIAAFDEAGCLLEVNEAFGQLLGYDPEALIETTGIVPRLLGANDQGSESGWSSLLQTGEWRGELEIPTKSGAIVSVEASAKQSSCRRASSILDFGTTFPSEGRGSDSSTNFSPMSHTTSRIR